MYDITQLTFLTSPIAFALTYLLHSTAWILLMLCVVKLPFFSTPLLKNYLWKGALIGGLLTSLLIHFSGNSLLEIQLAKENSSVVASKQQPAIDEQFTQVIKEELIPANEITQVAKEPLIIDVVPEKNKVKSTIIKERITPLVIEKETPKTSFKIFPFMLLFGCLLWAIGTIFFITKETIRHFVFIKKIGERTSINHPTFHALLKQIRLKLGQKLSVDLSHSPILESPILIKNQEICLPEQALSKLKSDQIEAMLAHEIAHVVRKDYYWNCFLLGLDTLLFFQPLHRLAIKEIQTTNELLCDEWAAKIIGNNLALAQCLLTVATWMKTPAKNYPLVAGMSLKKSELSNRITSLINLPDMKKQRFNFLKAGLPFVAFLALAIFVLPGFTFTSLHDTTSAPNEVEDNTVEDEPFTYHQHTHVHVTDDEPAENKKASTGNLIEKVHEIVKAHHPSKDRTANREVRQLESEKINWVESKSIGNEESIDYIPIPKFETKVSEKPTLPVIRLEEKFTTNRNHPYFKLFQEVEGKAVTEGRKLDIKGVYFANLSCAGTTRQKKGSPIVTNRGDKNSLIFTLDYGDRIEYDTLQNCVHPPKEETNNTTSEILESFKVIKKFLQLDNDESTTTGIYGSVDGDLPEVVESNWITSSDNQKQTPIGIKLRGAATMKIAIQTTKGQPVLTIADGIFEKGVHEFIFPHVNIKKGTYRLIITVDSETLSQNIRVKRTRFTNKKEKNTCAALLRAVKGNNLQKVKALVQTVDPNCEYREEGEPRSPLNAAARKGNVEIGKLLLAANADVEFRARGDEGALMGAARKGHLDFVKLMVENGAKVNKVVHGDGTALINAVRGGHYEIAEYLLEHGADPMLNVPGDENPIAHAVTQGDDMLDLLLKYRKSK